MNKMPIHFTLNGRDISVDVEPRKTLVDVIREDCGYYGTHSGCEHGVCGACTIIVDGVSIRSCLMFAFQAQGAVIETVELLAKDDKLHPLQELFIKHHALQCGFCTSGFLMLVIAAFRHKDHVSDDELMEILSSNLCRCTGYENIIGAVKQWLIDEGKYHV